MGVTRIETLADHERARFNEWVDKWIAIALRTGSADRTTFEWAVQDCYRYAGIPWPGVVVWVPSPLVLVLAAPAAALVIESLKLVGRAPMPRGSVLAAIGDAVDDAVGEAGAVRNAVLAAVGGAVGGAVGNAVLTAVGQAVAGAVQGSVARPVRDAVHDEIHGALNGAVDGAVRSAVRNAVGGAIGKTLRVAVGGAIGKTVRVAVGSAVRGAVAGAVDGAVGGAIRDSIAGAVGMAIRDAVDDVGQAVAGAVREVVLTAVDWALDGAVGRPVRNTVGDAVRTVILRSWANYIGGQFWVSGWYWGGAQTSFFRDVCGLELPGDLWDRGRVYEATQKSACWWWPHRHFVMVCERPAVIHRELTDPLHVRGWGSHRLHCETGPAVLWPDGWGVWAIHGVRVPQRVVETPETLTPADIFQEPNVEVRRVMMTRFGEDRLIQQSGAVPIHADDTGQLYRVEIPNDEPLVMVRVLNSTPEANGSQKPYWLRVPPDITHARQAVAWSFSLSAGEYRPVVET